MRKLYIHIAIDVFFVISIKIVRAFWILKSIFMGHTWSYQFKLSGMHLLLHSTSLYRDVVHQRTYHWNAFLPFMIWLQDPSVMAHIFFDSRLRHRASIVKRSQSLSPGTLWKSSYGGNRQVIRERITNSLLIVIDLGPFQLFLFKEYSTLLVWSRSEIWYLLQLKFLYHPVNESKIF